MTDFDKVRSYYDASDEWGRFDTPAGRLEFDITLSIIAGNVPQRAEILDLGGGPGRYTIALAELGHGLHLADLSQGLLDVAKQKIDALGLDNVRSIHQVNAVDLRVYADASFDAVLVFGPLYHLTEEAERHACVREVRRVLKENGVVFAAFIPRLSGAIGVADRMFRSPAKVSAQTLDRVFERGVYNNLADWGWQEAYFPTSAELGSLFDGNGFSKVLLRSVRGWGDTMEEQICRLRDESPEKYAKVMEWIDKTAEDAAVVEMCGHAIYVGRRR